VNRAVVAKGMPVFLIPGNDPWLAILISDARAAQRSAESLRGAERRIDGPFAIWDGKAGTLPVTIVVTQPGGPGAWYAATHLAVRRLAPTCVIGVTPITVGIDSSTPERFWSTDVHDLESLGTVLSQVETTAVFDLPERVSPPVNLSGVPRYRSAWEEATLAAGAPPRTTPATTTEDPRELQLTVENEGERYLTSSGPGMAAGSLGCWSRGDLESPAAFRWLQENLAIDALDRESAGLAEAATECGLPWAVIGPCRPFPDLALQGHLPTGNGESFLRPAESPLHSVLTHLLKALISSERTRR